jgi:hypothetical protein
MKFTALITLSLLFVVASCHTGPGPQQQKLLEVMAYREVTCEHGADCKRKWNRAIEWVNEHSETGIKAVSDNLIATNLESSGTRPPFKFPEFSVVRYMQDEDTDVIKFGSYCEHGFTCTPTALQLRAEFVNYIIGLPRGVKKTGPDSYYVTDGVLSAPAVHP